jgi:hypothetical protein
MSNDEGAGVGTHSGGASIPFLPRYIVSKLILFGNAFRDALHFRSPNFSLAGLQTLVWQSSKRQEGVQTLVWQEY